MFSEYVIREKVMEYIVRVSKDRGIDPEQDLFTMRFSNSLFYMQLILFIEKEFDISVDNNDIGGESFRTINGICQYVTLKLA